VIVRLTQIDGKLPNLALMKIARHHRAKGDEIHFTKSVERELFEIEIKYDVVYGSAIFDYSLPRVERLRRAFPGAIVGGTFDTSDTGNALTVESVIGGPDSEAADWSLYPRFDGSLGFTQRGCRFKCGFCNVPRKEGQPRPVGTIASIWRGEPYPRHIHLLDNDFFGQPKEDWRARIAELRDGGFKVCFNQGINIRMITDETAAALASVKYRDDSFARSRLYTAWDNIGHERRFFEGIDTLERNGVPGRNVMAYMLVGYDPAETWERVMYRLWRMDAREVRPYPMVFGDRQRGLPLGGSNLRIAGRTLGQFQRWVIQQKYKYIPFEEYDVNAKGQMAEPQVGLFDAAD
jgi:hypothetical protein